MIQIRRRTAATPEEVFDVLGDGWLYPVWVVGASRMRAVDDAWPLRGARLHHSFGVWPALINDQTVVLEHDPPNWLVLQARGWPMGEATVQVRVEPWGTGSLITITEDATSGPGRLVPRPVRQATVGLRNLETLRRLTLLAEGRAGKTSADRVQAGD
jgi:uncharacterized protein YndB with AHSA1/START domain